MSVLAILGNAETPTPAMLAGLLRVLDEGARRQALARRGWHSMYASTACPGDPLRNRDAAHSGDPARCHGRQYQWCRCQKDHARTGVP